MKNSVPVGLATIVGYGSSALLAGWAVVEANEGGLNGPAKWLLIIAAAKAALTSLGRQLQAAKNPPLGELPPPVPASVEQSATDTAV